MSWMEIAAAVLGLACVAFGVQRSLWTYPTGIGSVALLCAVFLHAKLYSDALLQLFFIAANLYGWREWRRSIGRAGEVAVGTMTVWERIGWAITCTVAAAGWGALMYRHTDAAFPHVDAGVAVTSVAAQLLMARRRWENWVLWIGIDLASVPLFLLKGLWVTTALYGVYLALAVWGLIGWRRARHRVGPAVA